MPVTAIAEGFDPPRMSCMKKLKVWSGFAIVALVAAATLGLGCVDANGAGNDGTLVAGATAALDGNRGATGSTGCSSRIRAEVRVNAILRMKNRR